MTGCASTSEQVFKEQTARPNYPLCRENKPSQNYSLTIYAYNDVQKGTPINEAGEQLKALAKSYDFFAKAIIPDLLLNSYIERYQNEERDKADAIRFVFMNRAVMSFTNETSNRMVWSGENLNISSILTDSLWIDRVTGAMSQDGRKGEISKLIRGLHDLSFIPTSSKGDELVVCPASSCKNLLVPRINKTIENVSEDDSLVYGVKENHFDKIERVDFDKFNDLYFLYDIIGKSGLTLGKSFNENYYVIPEANQSNICKDISQTHPEKDQTERCFKKEIDADCNEYISNKTCHPTEMQRTSFMDAVARDYAENVTFETEKKNEGKWTIYKIKINPEFICKYGRSKSELVTK